MAQPNQHNDLLVLDSAPAGVDKIPAGTPLTRLNYYDGLFLRAAHLDAEQRYTRALAGFANQGLGAGLVHGFSAELEAGGDTLVVRAGLAFDAQGRTLFLPRDVKVGVQELIDRSRQAVSGSGAPGGLLVGEFGDCTVVAAGGGTSAPVPEGTLYQIVVCHLEALCGQEDVYGRVCETACASDVERPWRVEGVVLRALPLALETPFPQSLTIPLGDPRFLRSNVAHAFFEDERRRHPHLISAAGLRSPAWCRGAQVDLRGCEVPLGVLAREGQVSLFLDPWTLRRERMETPSRRYWDWRMAMRPWDVFLAQVLQFQCQLSDGPDAMPPSDPCADERQSLGEGVRALEATLKQIQESSPNGLPAYAQDLSALRDKLAGLLAAPTAATFPGDAHVLLDRGIAELPPAGWLPVVAGQVVQPQVRALLGAGVDLRFCVVRPDYVGHALEEAQHLERIPLTPGLDDPTQLQEVDVLVPNGTPGVAVPPSGAQLYRAQIAVSANAVGVWGRGAAREGRQAAGDLLFALAGSALSQSAIKFITTQFKPAFAGEALDIKLSSIKPDLSQSEFINAARNESLRAALELDSAGHLWRQGGARFDSARLNLGSALGRAPFGKARVAKAAVDDARFGNFWVEGHLGRDPFELAAGQSTSFSLRVTAAEVGDEDDSSALTATFAGTLTVDERVGSRLQVGFSGEISFGMRRVDGGKATWLVLGMSPVSLSSEKCALKRAGGTTTFEYLLSETTLFELERSAGPNAQQVAYLLRVVSVDPQTGVKTSAELAQLDLGLDPAVAQASDPDHSRAATALGVIQAALGPQEPDFQAEASQTLFGGALQGSELAPLVALHDWVFFHRRRSKDCGGTPTLPPPPPPLQKRAYRLVHLAQDTPLGRIKDVLADPAAAPAFVKLWQNVGSLEFERSSAQLLSPTPQALLQAWKAVAPGQRRLIVAFMATPGDEESRSLEETRGKLVVDVVRDGVPADTLEGDVLAEVPAVVRQNFNLAADEGLLFIESLAVDGTVAPPPPPVTPPPPALQQHEVLLANADQLKRAQTAARNGTFSATHVNGLERLGVIDFKPGTDDATSASFRDFERRWRQLTGGAPVAAALSLTAAAADAATRDVHAKQAQLLMDKLGTQAAVKAATVPALPSSAATLTLLLPVTPG